MTGLIRYLILANVSLIVIAFFYQLALSRETWFKTNRFILLAGVLISLTVPFLHPNWIPAGSYSLLTIPEILVSAKSGMPHFDLDEIQIFGTAPFVFPWLKIIIGAYLIGALTTGLSLLWRIKKIQSWTRHYPMKWFRDLYITILPENFSPFSFLGIVYYPEPFDKHKKQSQLILDHESVHIRQKHSWDVIFIDIVRILFFYNPAVYTIKKQIQVNHEYIADNEVVGNEKQTYSQELLRSQLQVPQFQFIQPFNQSSLLKRRLIMIMKEKTRSTGKLKYLLFIPVAASLLWFSACTDEAEPEAGEIKKQTFKTEDTTVNRSSLEIYAEAILEADYADMNKREKQTRAIAIEMGKTGATDQEVNSFVLSRVKSWAAKFPEELESSKIFTSKGLNIEDIKQAPSINAPSKSKDGENDIFYVVEEMPEFDGQEGGHALEKFRDWIQLNVNYPDIAKQNGIHGTVYVKFIIDEAGKVTDVGIVRGVDPSLDNEVKRVLNEAPDWKPGKQKGKEVKVQMAIPVKFMLQ